LKEQETTKKGGKKKKKEATGAEKTEIQDITVVQNIYPSTSLPMEHVSISYMAINTFSQILTVIFQTNTLIAINPFSQLCI
jgi:ADP-ribose pyrophosphatase YjhB (NUDIX family)